jgi:hypothetical protein
MENDLFPPRTPSSSSTAAFLAAMDELNGKLRHLVDDFASGQINRLQFHSLYERYQRQLIHFQSLLAHADEAPLSEPASDEGIESTFHIKRRLTAKVLGVSVYNNSTGLPLETIGEFVIDPALLIPMLSSYRAATREIFKAGMRSTAMENGQWLGFVPGNYTTLIALYSFEPSTMQMNMIEQMHRDFETANAAALERGQVDPSTLAFPFLTFVQQAKNNTGSHQVVQTGIAKK